MAIEEYFEGTFSHPLMDEDQSSPKKWKSVSACATASEDSNGCFECNICLDHAQDPVVTLCGHLYCWPCIYKWLHFQTTSVPSNERHQQQQCPVCKADVSSSTLVPLYGRGHSSPETKPDGKTSSSTEIPQRPPAHGVRGMVPHQLQSQFEADEHQQYHPPNHNNYAAAASSPIFSLGGTTTHPMVWMFGEMVCTRMFGNSTAEVGLYGYRNSYHRMGSSPRVRRQEMKAEKSLNRISIFLFCCLVLCLLLF